MLQSNLQDTNLLYPGVILINSKKYAVNLLWNDVPDDKKYKAIIKSRLKLLESNLFAISSNLTGKQYAIADKHAGHQKNQVALASCIDNNGSSLCALFQHEDLWVLLAMDRNGCVVIDKAGYDQNEIVQIFYSTYYEGTWDNIVCPAELGVPDSVEKSIYSFLNKKGVKLCSIGIDRLYPPIFIGGVCVLCAVLAYVFQNAVNSKEKEQTVVVNTTKPEEIDVPWGGHSKPEEFVKLCVNNASSKYLQSSSIPGWTVDPAVVCDEKGRITLSIKKDFGLRIWLTESDYKNVFVGELPEISMINDSSANISWPLHIDKYKETRLSLSQLVSKLEQTEKITKYLQDTFESYFIPLKVDAAKQENGGVKQVSFSFSLRNEPTMVLPILSKVSNLVIDQCVFNAGDSTWEVKGTYWGS
ncbi:type 4b pilus protein PilO2 [Escherichia coli]|nr:type 4b pilus protein PilO2 [Escherichia coli]